MAEYGNLWIGDLQPTMDMLLSVQERIRIPAPMMEEAFAVLQGDEQTLFDSYGGKFVKTGALEASLTQRDAPGAIREMHGHTLRFGSRIWYAHFQRHIVGPSGKLRGMKREKPSYVIRATSASAEKVSEMLARYIGG